MSTPPLTLAQRSVAVGEAKQRRQQTQNLNEISIQNTGTTRIVNNKNARKATNVLLSNHEMDIKS